MDDLNALIAELDDATAERVLIVIARNRLNSSEAASVPLTADLGRELAAATGIAPSTTPVGEGDLARQCLLVLATEPSYQPALRGLIQNPPAQKMMEPSTAILLGTVALCLLQSSVKIKRDGKGKWTFEFHKPTLANPLVKGLIAAVASYLGGK
jgi:hypothetical protein